jgi:pyruvate/2-oxoglutarate dehydrogenase complex dihydrolipoamide acyltransferase (E2) component
MSMQEATIAKWRKHPGESFHSGDALYDIETEKVTQEVTAPADGMMIPHLVAAGAVPQVGAVVCVIETAST